MSAIPGYEWVIPPTQPSSGNDRETANKGTVYTVLGEPFRVQKVTAKRIYVKNARDCYGDLMALNRIALERDCFCFTGWHRFFTKDGLQRHEEQRHPGLKSCGDGSMRWSTVGPTAAGARGNLTAHRLV